MTEKSTFQQRLSVVKNRMAAACRRSGRSIDDVTLIAVSKTFPFSRLEEAYTAGQLHFGENYMQDCLAKMEQAKSLGLPFKWHFIGHLQSNKAKYFNPQFYLFHALDSLKLAQQLARVALSQGLTASVLVQVNIALEASKSGVAPMELIAFLDKLRYIEGLSIEGLMTIPPVTVSSEESRPYYRDLFTKFHEAREAFFLGDPAFRHLSMGMSNDFEIAIEEGATCVRVGSLLFGDRTKRI
ncbi:MAG: YggS family pyridoxal phosphate-dependent enzyme [Pseudomonadota bacterium]|nr:YggS family pyridoxal phosphate-dependent enzyme [Pseudomonadota bacterium]